MVGEDVLSTVSADGTNVRATREGGGSTTVVILPPGMDGDGATWRKPAALLSATRQVVRMHRRQYRVDLPGASPCSIAQEVEDVLALVRLLDGPIVLVGHSSGGVVALEALVAAPTRFAGAVIYEAPIVIGPPLGGEMVVQARAALAEGKPARALALFLREVVQTPEWVNLLSYVFVPLVPRVRALVPGQINDCAAIDELGVRLDAYAQVQTPVVLLGGQTSPAHLAARLDALERALPHCRRVLLEKQGHSANSRAPARVVEVIESAFGR